MIMSAGDFSVGTNSTPKDSMKYKNREDMLTLSKFLALF